MIPADGLAVCLVNCLAICCNCNTWQAGPAPSSNLKICGVNARHPIHKPMTRQVHTPDQDDHSSFCAMDESAAWPLSASSIEPCSLGGGREILLGRLRDSSVGVGGRGLSRFCKALCMGPCKAARPQMRAPLRCSNAADAQQWSTAVHDAACLANATFLGQPQYESLFQLRASISPCMRSRTNMCFCLSYNASYAPQLRSMSCAASQSACPPPEQSKAGGSKQQG